MNELTKEEIAYLIGKEDPIILDVGAYDGRDGRELAALFDNPVVWSFEPINQVEKFKHGRTIRAAVTDVVGRKRLYTADHMQSCSIRKPKKHLEIFPEVKFDKSPIEIDCITLDHWYNVHYYYRPTIDFIWCDVNGSEAEFIKGGYETLLKTRYLYIEVSDRELYEGQSTKDEVIQMLPDYWHVIGLYNYKGNFGNLLLKNTLCQ